MSQPSCPSRIAIADDEADRRGFLEEVLSRLGHQVVAAADSGGRLLEQCSAARPDLVVTDIKMPDVDGMEAAAALNRVKAVPVILVTVHPDVDFLARAGEGCFMAYLTKPIKPIDLQAAIALAMMRLAQLQKLAQEAASLPQAREDRTVVEGAKRVLMTRSRVDEQEAFLRLRKLAGAQNRKVMHMAGAVVAAHEVFQTLERDVASGVRS